jgi:hypothetical protein
MVTPLTAEQFRLDPATDLTAERPHRAARPGGVLRAWTAGEIERHCVELAGRTAYQAWLHERDRRQGSGQP